MHELKYLFAFAIIFIIRVDQVNSAAPWGWRCNMTEPDSGACKREEKVPGDTDQVNFLKCKLTCGTYGALWPRPTTATLGNDVTLFLPGKIQISTSVPPEVGSLVNEAIAQAQDSLYKYNPDYATNNDTWPNTGNSAIDSQILSLQLFVTNGTSVLSLGTNESYTLTIEETLKTTVTITAETFYGVRHGLETFTQLVDYDEDTQSLQIVNNVTIYDSPTYPYRGIILDTARNFIPVADIKRTLDAMSYNKLNSLHWHITDTHSYPLVVDSLPNMAYYGRYSEREVYTSADVKDIVSYGNSRGVRIIPEFDAPAHVGNGWQWGQSESLGDLVVCLGDQPWTDFCVEPPCGQLNIANDNIYTVLQTMYTDWMAMFDPVTMFHFGGDEIMVNCWNSSSEIRDWMKANGNPLTNEGYIAEWSKFQAQARDLALAANGGEYFPSIIWTSDLTASSNIESYLPKEDYIIQIWTASYDAVIGSLLSKGYKIIFSNYDALYFDCGFGNWISDGNNWCTPFKGWKDVYDNSPKTLAGNTGQAHSDDQVVGGEAAFWTEQGDENNLDSRLWPRAAALGERLWHDDTLKKWRHVSFRLIHHRQRMVQRGIRADREMPDWCHQNDGECTLYYGPLKH